MHFLKDQQKKKPTKIIQEKECECNDSAVEMKDN